MQFLKTRVSKASLIERDNISEFWLSVLGIIPLRERKGMVIVF